MNSVNQTAEHHEAPLLLTIARTAMLLGIAEKTFRNLHSRGKLSDLPSVRIGQRRMYRRVDVERYVASLPEVEGDDVSARELDASAGDSGAAESQPPSMSTPRRKGRPPRPARQRHSN